MLPKGNIMTEFKENVTERLLREVGERPKRFGDILSDAINFPLRQVGAVGGSLADVFSDPAVRDQFADLQRGYGSALGSHAVSSGYGAAIQKMIDSNRTSSKPQITSAADLGTLIRKARKAMKLSQGEFAAHAGVGRRFVSELEAGKSSLEFDKVLACAAAAGVDIIAHPRRAG